jgi:hypothetical protein
MHKTPRWVHRAVFYVYPNGARTLHVSSRQPSVFGSAMAEGLPAVTSVDQDGRYVYGDGAWVRRSEGTFPRVYQRRRDVLGEDIAAMVRARGEMYRCEIAAAIRPSRPSDAATDQAVRRALKRLESTGVLEGLYVHGRLLYRPVRGRVSLSQ